MSGKNTLLPSSSGSNVLSMWSAAAAAEYIDRTSMTAAPTLQIEVGGHARLTEMLAGILPASESPVCEGANGGCHGCVFPQTPLQTPFAAGDQG